MDYKPVTDEIDDISLKEGKEIFINLRNLYPANTNRDLDIILNSISIAFICLARLNVPKEKHSEFIKLFNRVIEKNI